MSRLAILSAPGSRGDVNPMVAIGRELKQLGFEVVISLAQPYAEVAEDYGLTAEPIIGQDEFDRMLSQPSVWKPVRGVRTILGDVAATYVARHHELILRHHRPGETILVSHPLDFASRVFRDAYPETPLADVHLSPAMLRTWRDPPRVTPWPMELHRPGWAVKAAYWLADHLILDPAIGPAVNRLRQTYGLPPVRRLIDKWWLSPDLVLAMYPQWFAPAAAEAAAQLVHVGFPVDDADQQTAPLPSNRPIVFTTGTAHRHSRDFFQRAVRTCEQLQIPGLLLSSHSENWPEPLPELVRAERYVSLSRLLPHCAAIVHHGGIGTTSQALAAATPQLIRPLAFDQFDNAARVQRLGCGYWLQRDASLAKKLGKILGDAAMKEQCREIAVRFSAHDVAADGNEPQTSQTPPSAAARAAAQIASLLPNSC